MSPQQGLKFSCRWYPLALDERSMSGDRPSALLHNMGQLMCYQSTTGRRSGPVFPVTEDDIIAQGKGPCADRACHPGGTGSVVYPNRAKVGSEAGSKKMTLASGQALAAALERVNVGLDGRRYVTCIPGLVAGKPQQLAQLFPLQL